jgi:hypothetical protein
LWLWSSFEPELPFEPPALFVLELWPGLEA